MKTKKLSANDLIAQYQSDEKLRTGKTNALPDFANFVNWLLVNIEENNIEIFDVLTMKGK